MKFVYLLLTFVVLTGSLAAQAGRNIPKPDPSAGRTGKELFDEANAYRKTKYAEFEKKKLPVSDALIKRTEIEQKQLAAKNAAMLEARKDLGADDVYYLALLHWVADNLDSASIALTRFLAFPDQPAERVQTARSLIVVITAKKGRLDEAVRIFGEYEKNTPAKISESLRMNTELAKAFLAASAPEKAIPFADAASSIARMLVGAPGGSGVSMDVAFDTAMLLFDAYRLSGQKEKAEAAINDLRKMAGRVGSSAFYFYAADKLITYQIESGRREAATDTYLSMMLGAAEDLADPNARAEVIAKLKRREKHYKILGGPAPELVSIDKWLPGEPTSLAALKGKVILLDFWATWCAPCYDAFPHLIEWDREFADKGLVIIGVTRYYGSSEGLPSNEAEEFAYLERFKEKHKLPYAFAIGKDQETHLLYGATALPTAAIIDRHGIVRYLQPGTSASRLADMREMIVKLLAEK